MKKIKEPSKAQLVALREEYKKCVDDLNLFRQQVASFFSLPRFSGGNLPLVHSVKSRLKDPEHLEDKLKRKWKSGGAITPATLLSRVTDLAGVRVLHLHTEQFASIHDAIQAHIDNGNWSLHEKPVAYSWDPEATAFFHQLGLDAVTRDTYYTSIHYVVKPYPGSKLTCEIQVRTLFEEAWGEIDHALNYPAATTNVACKEQLRVLAKLASTGTRLADAIFKSSKAGAEN